MSMGVLKYLLQADDRYTRRRRILFCNRIKTCRSPGGYRRPRWRLPTAPTVRSG